MQRMIVKKAVITDLNSDSLKVPTYDPDGLIDGLIDRLNLKNDAALSRLLQVAPPVISKIRHRRIPVGASLLLRVHEATDIPIRELRMMAGLPIPKFGAAAQGGAQLKKIIAWPVAWALYWMGDLMCRPLHTDAIGNGPEWLANIFYRPYNRLMIWSVAVQDWGSGGGPWNKIENWEIEEG